MSTLWIAPDVEKFFQEWIIRPIENPLLFSPRWTPRHNLFIMFGRQGVGKTAMIGALAKLDSIPVIKMSIPELGTPIDTVCDSLIQQGAQLQDVAEPHILLIEHGQYLMMRANSHSSQLLAISLKDLVKDTPHTIILTCDVLPTKSNPFEQKFYAQFDKGVFAGTPTLEARKRIFDAIFKNYAIDLLSVGRSKVDVRCDDNLLEWLSMCSGYATPKQIHDFCRKVFYSLIHTGDTSIVLDQPYLQQFMFGASGADHICMDDLQKEEGNFSRMCGGGLVLAEKRKHQSTPAVEEKRAKMSGFTEENADFETAKTEIQD